MNQKTAKLLRKFSRFSGKPIQELKEIWLNSSAKEKANLRAELEKKLESSGNQETK